MRCILYWSLNMSDNRGRGPFTNEGRIERNPSRGYENLPGGSSTKKPPPALPNTSQRVNDVLKRK